MRKKKNKGGRPKGEPTVVSRYPAALQAEIDKIVKEYKEAKRLKKEQGVIVRNL